MKKQQKTVISLSETDLIWAILEYVAAREEQLNGENLYSVSFASDLGESLHLMPLVSPADEVAIVVFAGEFE